MHKIVVGIDGSAQSFDALRWAQDAARAGGGSVQARSVWTYPTDMSMGMGVDAGVASTAAIPYEELQGRARRIIDEAFEAVPANGVDRSGEAVLAPSVTAGLIEAADGADLLVIGTRHHSKLERFFGSTAIQCAQYAPCPFVAVPQNAPSYDGQIAIAYDGSDHSTDALRWAAAVPAAAGEDPRLRVITVWEDAAAIAATPILETGIGPEDRAVATLRMAVGEVIPDAAGRVEYRPINESDDVSQHLLEAADGTTLLVMGSRGRGGFRGLLLGSVSQRVLESSSIAVAVIRP